VRPVDVEEIEQGPADAVSSANATRKLEAILADGDPGLPVLAVDTVVSLHGTLYGKPGSEEDARATLRALSGASHEVWSAMQLWRDGRTRGSAVQTHVTFRHLDEALLGWYLATGEWRDRAGGYAIQGRGAGLVQSVRGDYFNVVGLPVAGLLDLWPDLVGAGRPS
jgi:septum formation protein